MNRYIVVFLVLIHTCFLIQNRAQAQAGGAALKEMKQDLSLYDVHGDGTMRIIRRLTEFIDDILIRHEVKKARYMRALAAADLIIIAHVTGNDSLKERLATSMQMEPNRLLEEVIEELYESSTSRDFADAQKAGKTLKLIRDGFDPTSRVQSKKPGMRWDILMLGELSKRLKQNSSPGGVLEQFGQDPCPPEQRRCPKKYTYLSPSGRRAVVAFEEASEAILNLQLAARKRDPLALALEDFLLEIRSQVGRIVLRPAPLVKEKLALIAADETTASLSADILMIVKEDEVQLSFVPGVRLSALFEIENNAPGEPMLPDIKRIKLPASYKPYMRHIAEVTEALKQAIGDNTSLSVAVGPAAGLPAHILGRVLLSILDTGIDRVQLLANTEDGATKMVAIQTTAGQKEEEAAPSKLNLRIRLGGYTLKVGLGNKEDIPRIRTDQGFLFDIHTLSQKVSGRRFKIAEVSFMGDVNTEILASAIYHIAPKTEMVEVFIPQ